MKRQVKKITDTMNIVELFDLHQESLKKISGLNKVQRDAEKDKNELIELCEYVSERISKLSKESKKKK